MEIDIAEDCWLLKYYMQRSMVITVSTSGFSEVQRVGVRVPLEYFESCRTSTSWAGSDSGTKNTNSIFGFSPNYDLVPDLPPTWRVCQFR